MKLKRGICLMLSIIMLLAMSACSDKVQNSEKEHDKDSSPNIEESTASNIEEDTASNIEEDTASNIEEDTASYRFVSEGNSADRLNPQSGGADEEAKKLRESIMNTKDQLNTEGGTVYYISSLNGDDKNDGKSPETAWKTIAAHNKNKNKIKAGDFVLFERGGIYRSTFSVISGVSYGAYGEGPKPAIYGSKENYSGEGYWTETETPNIWVCSKYIVSDAGTIVFNHGQAVGIRRFGDSEELAENLTELKSNFEFYHDMNEGRIYLYLEKNPSEVFYDIEICEKSNIISGKIDCTDVTIDNLSIKYGGGHGISFSNGSKNIKITNCEFGWIGGSILSDSTRYGNAIEFWQGTSDILVENNWIYQIYDSGVTHQGSDNGGFVQENITIRGNLIEYCVWALEFWTGNAEKDIWRNIVYEDNIARFSGYGWGMIRTNRGVDAAVCGWGHSGVFHVENFVIRNNIFDVSKSDLIRQYYDGQIDIKYTGNTYYQREGKVALWTSNQQLLAEDQETFEAAIRKIDSEPKLIKFLE